MKRITLITIIITVLLSGCSSNCPEKEVTAASDAIVEQVGRFAAAATIADSTPRMQLAGQIQKLSDINMDTQTIEVPPCLEDYKSYVTTGFNKMISAYTLFMAEEDTETISIKLKSGIGLLEHAENELARVQACVPNCK